MFFYTRSTFFLPLFGYEIPLTPATQVAAGFILHFSWKIIARYTAKPGKGISPIFDAHAKFLENRCPFSIEFFTFSLPLFGIEFSYYCRISARLEKITAVILSPFKRKKQRQFSSRFLETDSNFMRNTIPNTHDTFF